jgi:hypothetical protein
MPTSLNLVGAPVPKEVEFKSLLPLLEGTTEQHYRAIYGAYTDRQRMVIAGDHKLMWYPKIGGLGHRLLIVSCSRNFLCCVIPNLIPILSVFP